MPGHRNILTVTLETLRQVVIMHGLFTEGLHELFHCGGTGHSEGLQPVRVSNNFGIISAAPVFWYTLAGKCSTTLLGNISSDVITTFHSHFIQVLSGMQVQLGQRMICQMIRDDGHLLMLAGMFFLVIGGWLL